MVNIAMQWVSEYSFLYENKDALFVVVILLTSSILKTTDQLRNSLLKNHFWFSGDLFIAFPFYYISSLVVSCPDKGR